MENIEEKIIQKLLKEDVKTKSDLDKIKRSLTKKTKSFLPNNVSLLRVYHKITKNNKLSAKKRQAIESLLKTRPVRSLSGIVNVSVLTKPYPCPGKCLYCPEQKGIPKSYLESEPAVMRAIMQKYSPFNQVKTRLKALQQTGHPIDKIEIRIIGGTWSFYPKKYQEWFIKECFRSCNQFNKKRKRQNLKTSQKENESAKYRVVGLSIETRPDFINEQEVQRLRMLGVTMVELGIQSIYDDVLKSVKRGHGSKEIILATKLLKDAGFKICYQIMPNLPKSSPQKDKKMLKELFENPDFRPDYLKIYPTVVLKEAPLYKQFKLKKFKLYNDDKLIDILKEFKKTIPYYVRIQRLIRDIPVGSIMAGSKVSNLREVIDKQLKQEKARCLCIRCREIKENYSTNTKIYMLEENYQASSGTEFFFSLEDKKREKLYALLRLRTPSSDVFIKTLKKSCIIREIHTYGPAVSFSLQTKKASQHRGLGKMLIKRAEEKTKELGFKKIAVIASVGTRNYYRKLGYRYQNTYMIKSL